jgi:hypothetical protein
VQILLFFFVALGAAFFSKLCWFNPLVAWWWYPGLFHGFLSGAWSFVIMKDFICFWLLCKLFNNTSMIENYLWFCTYWWSKHALKMSRFYPFFITLHNLNRQNQQFKIVFYFLHTNLDMGSFCQHSWYRKFDKVCNQEKGKNSQIYIRKKNSKNSQFFCFKSDKICWKKMSLI